MDKILELKVTLEFTKPAVYRKIQVLDTFTLYELHHAIQIAFGWENYHLYSFRTGNSVFGNPQLLDDYRAIDDSSVQIGEILKAKKDVLKYEYDFGDSWEHSIILEKVIESDSQNQYPICVDGKMACPPEDCGGIPGYKNLVEAMKDKNHPEHDEFIEWLGKPFDSKAFDITEVNNRFKNIKKYIKKYEANFR